MRDAENTVMYVGKAKNLRNRVRSYFTGAKDTKTALLIQRVDSIEHVVCRNEYEALLLENNLIKEWRPRFNINLKDGKSYPVIRVTNEEYPRVFRTRRMVDDGSSYYGPYANVYHLDRYLDLIEQIFPLRKCRGPIKQREHPCLYYHIGRCAGVCAGKTSREEYRERVDSIKQLLGGEVEELVEQIQRKMDAAGGAQRFEEAANHRDNLAAIRALQAEQQVVDFDPDVRDYIALYEQQQTVSFTIFRMRGGKLLSTELVHTDALGEPAELIEQLVTQYYSDQPQAPEKLFVGVEPEVVEAIAEPLAEFFAAELGAPVQILLPSERRDISIIRFAQENARRDYEKRMKERGNLPALSELQQLLGLSVPPMRIEGFDIAQLAGTHTVASMVSFHRGIPDKQHYRRFHVKTLDGQIDDFAAMREVVARRYSRLVNEGKQLPDLILIDGGTGQVNAAVGVLQALEVSIPVVGLAKREEEIFLAGTPEPIRLPEGSPPLMVLQQVRDEAHRFATSFNQELRTKSTTTSPLERVPGIGPARSRKLLTAFGSLEALAEADTNVIAAEAKIPLQTAEAVQHAARALRTGNA
jgi:excinuclease ABC subunit C